MFNTDKLRSKISSQGGFAKANKFLVEFLNVPPIGFRDFELLSITCENAAFPTRSIQASEKLIYGTSYQMPYKHAYGEISMTFYLTENMVTKKAFDTWMNKIVDPITGDLGYYNEYTCDIKISKYRSTSENVNTDADYSVKLLKAWPSIVAEVAVSHSAGGEIAKLPVTFQYKKWVDSRTAATGRPNPHDR
jgi:hypothetical protein